MAGINLRGETSGSVEITSPAVAGDTSITLPTTNGTLVVEQTDRVSFASSVGIGTTQPEHALVVADTAELSRIRIRNDTASSGRYASLNLKTAGFDNGWSIYSEYNSSDTDNYLKIFKGDGTGTHMYFKDPAEVGIRSAFYHVDSNGSDNGDSCFGFVSTSSNPGFKIKSNGSERLRIEADGDLRLGNDDVGTNYGGIRGWDASTGNMIIDADKSSTGSAGSNLIIRCRGTEKLRVQNNGRVGINTDVPAHMLVVHTVSTSGYSTATGDTPNTNTLLHLENQNGNDGAGVDNYVAAKFGVGRGATSQGWLGYTRTADNQGAFFIKQRNAASSYPETIRFPSSGGVTFGGGANTANTLDDYEEGTYTPTFTCTSGSITLNGSFDIISYEKIGNCCIVHGRVRVSSVSSPSGSLVIGLPFTRANPGEDSARIGGTIVVQNGAGAVSNYLIHPTGATGVEVARGDTSSIDVTVANDFSGDELVYISVAYRTA